MHYQQNHDGKGLICGLHVDRIGPAAAAPAPGSSAGGWWQCGAKRMQKKCDNESISSFNLT
jgi:hypothetical protein